MVACERAKGFSRLFSYPVIIISTIVYLEAERERCISNEKRETSTRRKNEQTWKKSMETEGSFVSLRLPNSMVDEFEFVRIRTFPSRERATVRALERTARVHFVIGVRFVSYFFDFLPLSREDLFEFRSFTRSVVFAFLLLRPSVLEHVE